MIYIKVVENQKSFPMIYNRLKIDTYSESYGKSRKLCPNKATNSGIWVQTKI